MNLQILIILLLVVVVVSSHCFKLNRLLNKKPGILLNFILLCSLSILSGKLLNRLIKKSGCNKMVILRVKIRRSLDFCFIGTSSSFYLFNMVIINQPFINSVRKIFSRMKGKISICNITREMGVSSTTVSFIINGRGREKRITLKVEAKILKYIKEVGCLQNVLAKSLRTGKNKVIGLMAQNIADPFFSDIVRIFQDNTFRPGYKIFYSGTDNDTLNSKNLIKVFRERHVDKNFLYINSLVYQFTI